GRPVHGHADRAPARFAVERLVADEVAVAQGGGDGLDGGLEMSAHRRVAVRRVVAEVGSLDDLGVAAGVVGQGVQRPGVEAGRPHAPGPATAAEASAPAAEPAVAAPSAAASTRPAAAAAASAARAAAE